MDATATLQDEDEILKRADRVLAKKPSKKDSAIDIGLQAAKPKNANELDSTSKDLNEEEDLKRADSVLAKRSPTAIAEDQPQRFEPVIPAFPKPFPSMASGMFTPVMPAMNIHGVEPSPLRGFAPIVRGAGPTAVGAGIGALMGLPAGGIGAAPGALLGAGTMVVGDAAVNSINALFGTHYTAPSDAVLHLLKAAGVPEPETATERIIEASIKAASEAVGGAGVFGAASKIITNPVAKAVTGIMAENPIGQAISGSAGGAGGQSAEEAGAGKWTKLGATLASALIPGGLRAVFSPVARDARKMASATQATRDILQSHVTDNDAARIALQNAEQVNKGGVNMMSGDVIGDPAFLALQQNLRASSSQMQARDLKNVAAISENVAQPLVQSGATPQEAQQFFAAKNAELIESAQSAHDAAVAAGDTESQALLKQANDQHAIDLQKVADNKMSAEQAHEVAVERLKSATDSIKSNLESSISDTAGINAKKALEFAKETERQHVNSLYKATEGQDIPTDFKNTTKAAQKAVSDAGEVGRSRLPSIVQDIIDKRSPQYGKNHIRNVSELRSDLAAVNSEWSKASKSGDAISATALGKIKDGINQDLMDLESYYPSIKEANTAYSAYADRYINGASENVLRKKWKTDPSATLHEYMGTKEGEDQLRNAIIGNTDLQLTPELAAQRDEMQHLGLKSVGDYILNNLAKTVGKSSETANHERINTWMKEQGNRWLQTFPEARPRVMDAIAAVEESHGVANYAKDYLNQIKSQAGTETQSAKQSFKAAESDIANMQSDAAKNAKDALAQKQYEISKHPASEFIGGTPYEVVGNIMGRDATRAQEIPKLIQRAAQDPSGKAIEGVQNAVRDWMNRYVRSTNNATVGSGVSGKVVAPSDFQTDLGRINDLMVEGSSSRSAIESAFGKGSPEMNALDQARNQVDMMMRRSRAAGSKAKDFSEALESATELPVSPNLLTLVGRVGRRIAIGSGSYKKGAWGEAGTMIASALEKAWKGNVEEAANQMLVDAMLDPRLARIALSPIAPDKLPEISRALKAYGVVLAMPQKEKQSTEEE